jgi:ABC-type uncharacterized transport system fused permease/ATPase subunit
MVVIPVGMSTVTPTTCQQLSQRLRLRLRQWLHSQQHSQWRHERFMTIHQGYAHNFYSDLYMPKYVTGTWGDLMIHKRMSSAYWMTTTLIEVFFQVWIPLWFHIILLKNFPSMSYSMVPLYILRNYYFKHGVCLYTWALRYINRGFHLSSYMKKTRRTCYGSRVFSQVFSY